MWQTKDEMKDEKQIMKQYWILRDSLWKKKYVICNPYFIPPPPFISFYGKLPENCREYDGK